LKERCEFSISNGLAPKRIASLVKQSGTDDWKEYSCIEFLEYKIDRSSGVSLPITCRASIWIVTKDRPTTLLSESTLSFSKWNLNPPISDDLFTLQFPKGCLVEDTITGQIFVSAEIGDQLLTDMVSSAGRLTPSPNAWILRLVWITGAFAICLGLIYLWMRWR
jgi:hypothetical protein